jgi:hypothetical protein
LNFHLSNLQIEEVWYTAKKEHAVSIWNVQWGCTTGNAATVAHSTKTTTSGKDSVIEEQPLLLFM